jgi:hypothetical protein
MNKDKENKIKEIIEDWSDRNKLIKYHLEELNETIDKLEFTEKQATALACKIERINIWLRKLQSKKKVK